MPLHEQLCGPGLGFPGERQRTLPLWNASLKQLYSKLFWFSEIRKSHKNILLTFLTVFQKSQVVWGWGALGGLSDTVAFGYGSHVPTQSGEALHHQLPSCHWSRVIYGTALAPRHLYGLWDIEWTKHHHPCVLISSGSLGCTLHDCLSLLYILQLTYSVTPFTTEEMTSKLYAKQTSF